jgi:hypothetical protein
MKIEYNVENVMGQTVIWYEENGRRFSFIEDEANPFYQAYLKRDKPQVEHLTEIIPVDVANLHLAEAPASIEATQPDEADLTEGQN